MVLTSHKRVFLIFFLLLNMLTIRLNTSYINLQGSYPHNKYMSAIVEYNLKYVISLDSLTF